MAALKINSNTLTEFFKEKKKMPDPSFDVGDYGIKSSTGGKQTVSQEKTKYLKDIDWKKRTPLQNYLEFGSRGLTGSGEEVGREEQKKAIEQMKMESAASKGKTPIQEEEIPTITVSKPKRKIEKLYRVMYAGKGAESSQTYETKEEADAALKRAGGKGAVAGVNMSQETRGGEMLPIKDVQARKQRYMDQLSKTKEISKSESDRLKKIQALRNPQTEEEILQVAENRGRMEDALVEANEAKRAKDKEAGAGFADWKAKVKAGRSWEEPLNEYNQQLGLLKKAYSQARIARDPYKQFTFGRMIDAYQEGVPKEMGARRKAAQEGIIQEKNQLLAEAIQAQKEQQERERQTRLANPDFDTYYGR